MKRICGIIAFICCFFILGIIGSLETNNIGFGSGMLLLLIAGTVGTASGLYAWRG